jgi:hypothetical protein
MNTTSHDSDLRGPHGTLRIGTLAVAVLSSAVVGAPALAEDRPGAPERLGSAIAHLVPYSLDGSTLAALGELGELTGEPDGRVAATAAFIRAAAEIDLLAYTFLADDPAARDRLASALGTTPDELVEAIAGHVRQASRGAFAPQIAASADVLSCLESDERARCGPLLRRVADGGGASATAARMLLLRDLVSAVERARTGSEADGIGVLVEQSRPLCDTPGRADVASLCREIRARDAARPQLAEQVFRHAIEDLAALERAGQGDDPLVRLTSGWMESARARLGWMAFRRPVTGEGVFQGMDLPGASSSPGTLPLEILVAGPTEVSIALTPANIVDAHGSHNLGAEGDLALPGKSVLTAPFDFRPVIRPIKQLTDALGELRESVDRSIADIAGDGPSWITSGDRALGLAVDRSTTLVDLGRYVASARAAGYRRFALVGRRSDGQLAALPVSSATNEEGPTPANIPLLRVGPTTVDFTSSGPPQSFPRSELERLGPAVVRALDGTGRGYAIQGRPMMPFGIVFPSIDAVAAAAEHGPPECLLLLPP